MKYIAYQVLLPFEQVSDVHHIGVLRQQVQAFYQTSSGPRIVEEIVNNIRQEPPWEEFIRVALPDVPNRQLRPMGQA